MQSRFTYQSCVLDDAELHEFDTALQVWNCIAERIEANSIYFYVYDQRLEKEVGDPGVTICQGKDKIIADLSIPQVLAGIIHQGIEIHITEHRNLDSAIVELRRRFEFFEAVKGIEL